MADVGRENQLIPGQQLYGCMIPRPEYDEEIQRIEKDVAEQKLQSFKNFVSRTNSLDGLSEFERRQLIKLDTLAGTPMSIGYEVVPLDAPESVSVDTDSTGDQPFDFSRSCHTRSVSVKLMSDKLSYVDPRESKHLILESDGKSTYCISENSEEVEVGTEVVSADRVCTSLDVFPEDEESSASTNTRVSLTAEKGLSCVFECNKNMQVICPSPSAGEILKAKME